VSPSGRGIDTAALAAMDRETLERFTASVLWQLRLADAFWFIDCEQTHGLEAAEAANARVWARVGELAARDIAAEFGPFEPGLEGFRRAYAMFSWSFLVEFTWWMEADDLLVQVAECPAQTGRLKHGLGWYECRRMHQAEFEAFAGVMDPRITVACEFSPPYPDVPKGPPYAPDTPEGAHCRWRFSLGR
jgi:hypothetical protein